MTGMPIPMPAGPPPAPDERPLCKGCGWRYDPDPPNTSRAFCELCHGLNNDVARWVQTHPPSRRTRARIAKAAWLDLAKGAGAILFVVLLCLAVTGALQLLLWGLEQL